MFLFSENELNRMVGHNGERERRYLNETNLNETYTTSLTNRRLAQGKGNL